MLALLAALFLDTSGPDRRIVLELFEVGDLAFSTGDSSFPSIDSDGPPARLHWNATHLVTVIRRRVPGRSVQFQNGLLVVRATPREQRRVAGLLTELRFLRMGSLGP